MTLPFIPNAEVAENEPKVKFLGDATLTEEDWRGIEAQILELSAGHDKLWKYGRIYLYDPETKKVRVSK